MSETGGWEGAPKPGIRIMLRLGPEFEEAAFTVPAVPRVGDCITLHDDHPETGSVRVRYYRVRKVEWALSKQWAPGIDVYCDALPSPGSRDDSAGLVRPDEETTT